MQTATQKKIFKFKSTAHWEVKVISYILLVICLLLVNQWAKGQSNFGMWNTISVEKEFTKRFSAGIDEELRLKDNISRLNLLYTNIGVSYKPIKGLKLSLIYRLTENYSKRNNFDYRNRLMLDISYKYRLNNFVLSYQSRLQAEVRNNINTIKNPNWFWRNKFEVKYNFRKFSPYVGTELYYQIKVPKHPETDNGWHRIRIFGGADFKLNKNNTIGLYYLMQHEFYILDPKDLNILGLQYSLTLPHRHKSKKN